MESSSPIKMDLDSLEAISDELSVIYQYICHESCKTPSPVMSDYRNTETDDEKETTKAVNDDDDDESDSDENDSLNDIDHFSAQGHLLDVISKKLRHLKKAVDEATELSRRNNLSEGSQDGSTSSEGNYIGTLPLESLVIIKNEQIATLRAVLKANKTTAEVVISNLKSKYETEKAIVSETLMNLRRELNALKADKESFISLRSMFVTKCDLFVTQLSEIQRHLTDSEDHIKDLNLALRELNLPSADS